ncbi:MAG: dipeptidase [Halobacteriales archaeon]
MSSATPVFDYSAGTAWIVTEAIEEVIEAARDSDESVREAVQTEIVRQFRSNPDFRDRFKQAYDRAGVNLASVTVSGDPPRDDLLGWQARFDHTPWLRKVTSPEIAREVVANGEIGIVLNTQNLGQAIGDDVDAIEGLYNGGLRLFQLTYNPQNLLGAGCYARSDCGLSDLGVEAIERVNDLGGLIDLSHCGRATTLDAIDVSEEPVAITHAGCAAVAEHNRCKDDAVLEALASVDGYMGIVGVPWFLAPDEDDPSLEVFFEHLEHAISILGIDRVGIGTDFGHVDAAAPDAYLESAREYMINKGFPEDYGSGYGDGFGGMQRYTDWPVLREELMNRYTADEARGILGENFLSFWKRHGS